MIRAISAQTSIEINKEKVFWLDPIIFYSKFPKAKLGDKNFISFDPAKKSKALKVDDTTVDLINEGVGRYKREKMQRERK